MTRVNDRIRAPRVRVVTSDGQQLGVMTSREALAKAQSLGLDLVEIAGQADPPVCKIIDYGKFKYEQAKLKKQKSKSATRMKEVKFRVGTGQHDYNIKMGKYVYNCLIPAIALGAEVIGKRQKREEARIKRLAKKEAASGL